MEGMNSLSQIPKFKGAILISYSSSLTWGWSYQYGNLYEICLLPFHPSYVIVSRSCLLLEFYPIRVLSTLSLFQGVCLKFWFEETATWLAQLGELAPLCWEGGHGFKPWLDQHSGSLKKLRRNCCLCNDFCKSLDFLVFSDKDEKP